MQRYDAHCYYKQLTALDTHNVGRGRTNIKSALDKISARTLVIGFSSDLLIPVVEQQFIAEHVPQGTYAEVETCLLYTSPSPRDRQKSRMPSSA